MLSLARSTGSGTAGSPTTASASTCSSCRHRARSSIRACGTRPRRIGHATSVGSDQLDLPGRRARPGRARARGTTWRCGRVPRSAATTVSGGCTTRRSPAPDAASSTSGSDWPNPTTCSPGDGSATGRCWRRIPRWYQTLGLPEDPVASETWRDPFVFRDPGRRRLAHADHRARPRMHPRLDDGVDRACAQRRHGATGNSGRRSATPAGFGQLEVLAGSAMVDGRPTLVVHLPSGRADTAAPAPDGASLHLVGPGELD